MLQSLRYKSLMFVLLIHDFGTELLLGISPRLTTIKRIYQYYT